jgi:uncharacterized protein YbaR (Trm112 family)
LGEVEDIKGKTNPQKFLDVLKRHRVESKCKKYIYHFAIIDYLCHYNYEKKGENYLKTFFRKSKDAKLISAVPPKEYGRRFKKFMTSEVIINEQADSLSDQLKREQFAKFLSEFGELRHQHLMCHHCGRTYDTDDDPRVGNIDKSKVDEWKLDQNAQKKPGQ